MHWNRSKSIQIPREPGAMNRRGIIAGRDFGEWGFWGERPRPVVLPEIARRCIVSSACANARGRWHFAGQLAMKIRRSRVLPVRRRTLPFLLNLRFLPISRVCGGDNAEGMRNYQRQWMRSRKSESLNVRRQIIGIVFAWEREKRAQFQRRLMSFFLTYCTC